MNLDIWLTTMATLLALGVLFNAHHAINEGQANMWFPTLIGLGMLAWLSQVWKGVS